MNKNFSKSLKKAMVADVKAKVAADKSGVKATDMLIAEGFQYTDFISPGTVNKPNKKSTATKELHDKIGEIIKLGFTDAVQKLLKTPTNALTEAGKVNKRYWTQQVGARRSDFRRALQKRVTPPNRTRPIAERVGEALDGLIKLVSEAENAPFDLVDMLDALKDAKGRLVIVAE
tara:strand:- start:69 stop:590 length:522 start_codon:yes stop_codon:yes gene_type:complete